MMSGKYPKWSEVSPAKIIVITFQAFEAWAREKGVSRKQDETPAEFLRRFAQQHPEHQQVAAKAVESYQKVVYGRIKAQSDDLAGAEAIWKMMSN
jgi:hypothetical protein